jgi:threonine/homoserine/homoserine lactone efflux protein
MPFSTWLALATICILGAITPGVSLALVIKHTVGGSRASGMAAAIGHGVGVTLYALATTVGLTVVLASTPAAISTNPAVQRKVLWENVRRVYRIDA